MWKCEEVDKTGSGFCPKWGFGISGIQPSVSASNSEIYLHSIPVTSIIASGILVCCNSTKT
jgi:hypothetical protein